MANEFQHLETLIVAFNESLEREMGDLRREMREGVDRIERVTARHSGTPA